MSDQQGAAAHARAVDRLNAAVNRFDRRSTATLAAVALGLFLALAAGVIAASRGFDGLYGQDPYAYFDYGTVSVRQSLLHLTPLEPFFWPPGYPLLVAAASLVLGPVPLAGQLVSLLMGALVPALTVLLVHELWPDDLPLALLAGALVAVCGQLWQSSVVVMSDTAGLALATFSAFALVRYARTRHGAWLVVASAAIAYATLARWIYGLVAIPFAIYALSALLERSQPSVVIESETPLTATKGDSGMAAAGATEQGGPSSETRVGQRVPAQEAPLGSTAAAPAADRNTPGGTPTSSAYLDSDSPESGREAPTALPNGDESQPDPALLASNAATGSLASGVSPDDVASDAPAISPRVALLHAVVAIAVAALILVPAVAQPLIGLIRNPAQPASFAGNFQVYSWSPLNALRRDFFTADGHLAYSQPNGVYYAEAPANFAYFGPLLAVWILPGLWAARRWRIRTIVLIVGWAGIVFAFHAGAPWQNFRFALAYLPPAAILAAAGLMLAWRWFDADAGVEHAATGQAAGGRWGEASPPSEPGFARRSAAARAADVRTAAPTAGPHSSESHAVTAQAGPAPAAELRSFDPPVSAADGSGSLGQLEPPSESLHTARAALHPARAALRTIVAACVVVGLLTTGAAAARLVERFINAKDQDLALVHWVQSQAPANAELFTFGPTLTFRHYSSMPTFDLYDVSAPEVRTIAADPAPHYLLVDIGSVESQWLNQAPSTNYHLLRDELGLNELGTEGTYTLYEIDAPKR